MDVPSARPANLSLRWKVLVAILAPIVVLGALEGLVRILGIEPHRSDAPLVFVGADLTGPFPNRWDDDLFWSMAPGKEYHENGAQEWEEERVNAQGFRGPDFATPKPAGVRRVLCLGDSNTFGSSVPPHAIFAHRLRRWLDLSTTGRWEVINAGVPGYTLWQMVRYFNLRGAALDPDVVLVYAGAWNDYTPAIGGSDAALAEKVRQSKEGLGRLRLVQLLRSVVQKRDDAADRKTRQKYGGAYWSKGKRLDGARVPQDDFKRLLGELHDAVRARGARLVLIVPALPAKTRKDFPEGEDYAEIVRAVADERRIPIVDARKLLGDLGRPDQEIFRDSVHPSIEGHRIIFGALASELTKLGLEPPLPPAPDPLEPRSLQDFMPAVKLMAGEPLAPADATVLTEDAGRMRTPCPCVLRLDAIPVPPQAALVIEFAHGNPLPGRTEGTTFRILVGRSGSDPAPVLTRTYAADHTPGLPDLCRVDLASFAGQTITLVFEIAGTAGCGYLGNGQIHPYR